MNHLSYQTSVKLAKFLGKSAPRPIDKTYYCMGKKKMTIVGVEFPLKDYTPIYALEDVLSKPFCKIMDDKHKGSMGGLRTNTELNRCYYQGGFEAVEAEINRLIKEK